MAFIGTKKIFLASCLFSGIMTQACADTIDNPCGGPTALLAIVDRPSVGDSACVVPYGNLLTEFGYQYQELLENGQQENFPQATIRLGLPANNELVFLPPNYMHQSMPSQNGYSASVLGIKHEIGYTQHWVGTIEALFTLPSGSDAFGSAGLGEAFNGIINYSFNSNFDVTFMFGGSSQTVSSSDDGQRYTTYNPDLVFSWSPKPRMNFYGEVYGQSKVAPGQGSGFNFDGGIIYLLYKNITVDVEVGQNLSGTLGGFNHYVGTGIAIQL